LGADESLFARLQAVATPKTLTYQYRMNKTINQLANQLTYGGALCCANDDIARATIRPNQAALSKHYALEKWLLKALASHLDQSVILIDTDNVFEKSQIFGASLKNDQSRLDAFDTLLGSEGEQMRVDPQVISSRLFINYCEAAVTFYLVNALLQAGVAGSAIGIIAPYRAQVELLKKVQHRFEAKNSQLDSYKGLEVNTVDQYQGRDKDVSSFLVYFGSPLPPPPRLLIIFLINYHEND
jgi:DNA replication ATP-dependent helicase Dna2